MNADTLHKSEIRRFEFGPFTNNQAEWMILVQVFQDAWDALKYGPAYQFDIYMDSALVVNQYARLWNIKNSDLQQLAARAWSYKKSLENAGHTINVYQVDRMIIEGILGH
jgi:ribonuclease HI